MNAFLLFSKNCHLGNNRILRTNHISSKRGWMLQWKYLGAMVLAACLFVLLGGGKAVLAQQANQTHSVPKLPPLGIARQFAPGIQVYTVQLPHNQTVSKLLIFMPQMRDTTPISCIFIAPAGTPLIYGNSLGDDGNPKEYLPYVRAGFAVVAYEIDGDVPEGNKLLKPILDGAYAFRQAYAGITNAQQAISYAVGHIPNIDAKRLYTAGHSSAGTLSLQAAAADKRIAACIAYAPCCDLEARISPELLAIISKRQPGFDVFIHNISPINNTTLLKCPVFIFHADDDTNVVLQDNASFVEKLRQTNSQVTFVRVPTGNHYQSMIDKGIVLGIDWLQKLRLPAEPTKKPE